MSAPDGPEGAQDRPALARELDLQPHPEGGWYRRTWASPQTVTLPDGRVRPTATLIYFLLPAGEASAWHRVASDELWLAHTGRVRLEYGGAGAAPGTAGTAGTAGTGGVAGETRSVVVVGVRTEAGEVPQARVPAGVWQRTLPEPDDALVSCVVSPGFDFADFALE